MHEWKEHNDMPKILWTQNYSRGGGGGGSKRRFSRAKWQKCVLSKARNDKSWLQLQRFVLRSGVELPKNFVDICPNYAYNLTAFYPKPPFIGSSQFQGDENPVDHKKL